MIDVGYFVKRVESRPEWLQAAGVVEICSVSNCVSQPPDDWIDRWLHNDLGFFDRVSDAMAIVPPDDRSAYRLFAYRLYPARFQNGSPQPFVVPATVADPVLPAFRSLGFDAVSKSMDSILGFECSPLSCNSMAAEVGTNEHCLFESLEAAIAGATRFSVEQPEPGDYYVLEVLEGRGAA